MQLSNINDEFKEFVSGQRYINDSKIFFDSIKESFLHLEAPAPPVLFYPFVISGDEIYKIFDQSTRMQKILYSLSDIYRKNDNLLASLNIPEKIAELIKLDPGYKNYIPICRFDGFFNGTDYSFCEFNTDGSSGMEEINIIDSSFLKTIVGMQLKNEYGIEQFYLKKELLDNLLSCYKNSGGKRERPSIAIVDYLDLATIEEFRALQKYFSKKGYDTEICDIRNLKLQSDGLFCDNFKIDIIYRRAVTDDMIGRLDGINDFIEAYKSKAVCVVGPICSHIAHTKKLFLMLSSKQVEDYLSSEDLEFLRKRIPWTAVVNENLPELTKVLNNKNDYFLKPDNLNSGQGVISGEECSEKLWKEEINKIISYKMNNYLVQRKLHIPSKEIIYDKGKTGEFNINISTYIFNNKPSGFFVRVSSGKVINTDRGAYVVPVFGIK